MRRLVQAQLCLEAASVAYISFLILDSHASGPQAAPRAGNDACESHRANELSESCVEIVDLEFSLV